MLSEVERSLGRPPQYPVYVAPKPTPTVDEMLLPATLVVQLHSDVPQGVVRVWVDDDQVIDKDFSFYDRRFPLFRKAELPGEWSSELELDAGATRPLRVLVARSGEAATVRTMHAALSGGERRTLAIHLPAAGDAVVELQ